MPSRILTTPIDGYVHISCCRTDNESSKHHNLYLDPYTSCFIAQNEAHHARLISFLQTHYKQDRMVVLCALDHPSDEIAFYPLLFRNAPGLTDAEFDDWCDQLLSRFAPRNDIDSLSVFEKEHICALYFWQMMTTIMETGEIRDRLTEQVLRYLYPNSKAFLLLHKPVTTVLESVMDISHLLR